MIAEAIPFEADDKHPLGVFCWLPDVGRDIRGVVHIVHGMAEHAARYAHVAEVLTQAGYAVYANDQRGHGATAASDDELGFLGESYGFERLVRDLEELVRLERQKHEGLPIVLFAHSMGSYVAQWFLSEHGDLLAAAVLSGTAGKPNLLASAGRLLARAERIRLGARGRSKILDGTSFDRFNKQFAPNRTRFDWLSRDPAEVDKYIADPRCGFVCTTSLWVALLDALAEIAKPERQARIPKSLPIYVFGGSEDPAGENTKSVERLLAAYARAGIRDVTHRFYAGGRHEMLNETNRADVLSELVTWLDAKIAPPGNQPNCGSSFESPSFSSSSSGVGAFGVKMARNAVASTVLVTSCDRSKIKPAHGSRPQVECSQP